MDKLPPWLPQLCDPPHSPGSAGSTKLRNRRVSHHVSQRRHRREPGPHTTPRPPDPGGLSGIIHRLYQNEFAKFKNEEDYDRQSGIFFYFSMPSKVDF